MEKQTPTLVSNGKYFVNARKINQNPT